MDLREHMIRREQIDNPAQGEEPTPPVVSGVAFLDYTVTVEVPVSVRYGCYDSDDIQAAAEILGEGILKVQLGSKHGIFDWDQTACRVALDQHPAAQ